MKASQNISDALVVDLLPAGLELKNQNLADDSASLQGSDNKTADLLNQIQRADTRHVEFRGDHFVAMVTVNGGQPVMLAYLVRAVAPGTYQVPVPQVESMHVPQRRAAGTTEELPIVRP